LKEISKPARAANDSHMLHWGRFAVLAICLLAGMSTTPAIEPATVKVAAGTMVRLELQHHISSAFTPADSPVYFRVLDDIVTEGIVAISKGTVVTGRMMQTSDRAMMATSGSLNFGVRFVPAVDGQQIRVIASATRAGRDRENALVGWTIFWGLPGMMTHGSNAYVERGAVLEAQVLSDRRVVIGPRPALNLPLPVTVTRVAITMRRVTGSSTRALQLNLERDHEKRSVAFEWQLPPGSVASDQLNSVTLMAVNGTELPAEEPAAAVAGLNATFDAWAIEKYCHDGINKLEFRAVTDSAGAVAASFELELKMTRPKAKKS
jgi:hypothetical protein